MKPRQSILKKGGAYGARVTPKAAGRSGSKPSSASLNKNTAITHNCLVADNHSRPGFNFKGRPKKYRTDAERLKERRVRFLMQGLNTQGKPYRRHPNFINRAEKYPRYIEQANRERRRHILAHKLARYHRIAAANLAAGLTAHGRRRRKGRAGLRLLTPLETNYRLFRELVPIAPSPNWEISSSNLERAEQ